MVVRNTLRVIALYEIARPIAAGTSHIQGGIRVTAARISNWQK